MTLTLRPMRADERPLMEAMSQLYVHDMSAFFAGTPRLELGNDGRFALDPPLATSWQVPGIASLLIAWLGRPAGFAVIGRSSHMGMPVDHAIAEFFVVRKHRGKGLGTEAARRLFAAAPGSWEVAVLRANVVARAFWARAIGECLGAAGITAHDRSDADWNGTVFRFRMTGGGHDAAFPR